MSGTEVGPHVMVVQPYVPRYRLPLFARLRDHLRLRGIDLTIAATRGPERREDAMPDLVDLELHDRLEASTGGRLRWRSPSERWPFADLIIVEQAIKNLDTYQLLRRSRRSGDRVAMWGHGATYTRGNRVGLDVWKRRLTNQMDWFFAYTPSGGRHAKQSGFPSDRVTVVGNTLDTESLRADLSAISEEDIRTFRAELALGDLPLVTYLGRLESEKDIRYLVECLETAGPSASFGLLAAGSGPEGRRIERARARGLPVARVGRVDGLRKALTLRASQLLLIPSWVGLVAVDSLVAGVPIVTREGQRQMPESEYLRPGIDSLWLPFDATPATFAAATAALLADARRLARMRESALTSDSIPTLDGMVAALTEGIMQCLASPPRAHASR